MVIFHTHNLPDETHARTHNQPGDSRAIIPTLEEMTFLRKMSLQSNSRGDVRRSFTRRKFINLQESININRSWFFIDSFSPLHFLCGLGIPESGRSPEKEMATHSGTLAGKTPQMEATVHGVAKSWTQLSNFALGLWPVR